MCQAYISAIVNCGTEGKGCKLKVVHLVTSTSGGAAQAAIRLSESLVEAGYDSKIVSVQRRTKLDSNEAIKLQEIGKFSALRSSTFTFLQLNLIQAGDDPVSPISLDLLDWQNPDIESADVLHLHAFYNLVSINSFLRKFPDKKKIVTLHDERFYTGGCHYSHDCQRFVSGCQNCPQVQPMFRKLIEKQKRDLRNLTKEISNVVFVCPSSWILKRAIEALSEIQETNFIQVYNPIPNADVSLNVDHLNSSEIRFGFVSQNLDNPIKNLPLLLSAFKELANMKLGKYSLTLVGASANNYSADHPRIIQTHAENSTELGAALSAIDVLVVPSTDDNLPNVLGEALMNGVGLIGSDVGGIPEVIDLFRQSLFQSGDKESLIHAMQSYRLTDRMKLQKMAEEVFGYQAIANKMKMIYSS